MAQTLTARLGSLQLRLQLKLHFQLVSGIPLHLPPLAADSAAC